MVVVIVGLGQIHFQAGRDAAPGAGFHQPGDTQARLDADARTRPGLGAVHTARNVIADIESVENQQRIAKVAVVEVHRVDVIAQPRRIEPELQIEADVHAAFKPCEQRSPELECLFVIDVNSRAGQGVPEQVHILTQEEVECRSRAGQNGKLEVTRLFFHVVVEEVLGVVTGVGVVYTLRAALRLVLVECLSIQRLRSARTGQVAAHIQAAEINLSVWTARDTVSHSDQIGQRIHH